MESSPRLCPLCLCGRLIDWPGNLGLFGIPHFRRYPARPETLGAWFGGETVRSGGMFSPFQSSTPHRRKNISTSLLTAHPHRQDTSTKGPKQQHVQATAEGSRESLLGVKGVWTVRFERTECGENRCNPRD